jgi:cytochrome c
MRPLLAAMFRIGAPLSVGAFALIAVARPSVAADDVAAGQSLYQGKCAGCHSVDADRVGPRHRNVVGRPVAGVSGYSYSPALKKLGGVWTPARLDQFLRGTQKMAPGSKMYLEMDDPNQRRLIVAYLRSVSKPKK